MAGRGREGRERERGGGGEKKEGGRGEEMFAQIKQK